MATQAAKAAQKRSNVLRITESAIMIAFATVLSEVKVMDMPMGGSITAFSMLPVAIIAYRYGMKWGFFTGFVSGLFQMLLGMKNLQYGTSFWAVACIILFDYLVAFGVLGFGGLFRGKIKNQGLALAAGSAVACVLRFCCHFITGLFIWGVWAPEGMPAWLYSGVYNGSYMLPETIITVAGALLISLFLDFSSPSITRRRAKTEEALPRNNAALAAKLVGVVTVIGGILYSVSSVIYTFSASVQSGTEMELSSAAVTGTVVVCAVAGVVLYALGEMVQLLSDIRENQLKNKKNNTQD